MNTKFIALIILNIILLAFIGCGKSSSSLCVTEDGQWYFPNSVPVYCPYTQGDEIPMLKKL